MNAKELIIGDWVSIKRLEGFYYKTRRITLSDMSLLHKMNIVHIPLTAEILEKNGFKDVDVVVLGVRKLRLVTDDGRTEITISVDDTIPMDIVRNVYYEDEVSYTLPSPQTVSQLQHALRLCGLNELADNFKV